MRYMLVLSEGLFLFVCVCVCVIYACVCVCVCLDELIQVFLHMTE